MKKWRGLTDDEAQEELEQIALERQILEESSFITSGDTEPYPSGGNPKEEAEYIEEIDMTEE
jgi:hypothetical protein